MRYKVHQTNIAGHESGFTIIEIMIATAIFAIVLLIMIDSITNFFGTYNKSLVSTTTENTVQNISDQVDQAIKYSSNPTAMNQKAPTANTAPGYICLGNKVFLYYLGYEQPAELPTGQDVLYEEPAPPSCTGSLTEKAGGTSLLGTHYRLISFSVAPLVGVTNEYEVDIKISYTLGGINGAGDDLLCSPSISPATSTGGCAANTAAPAVGQPFYTKPDLVCKNETASQFCSFAELQTTVESRL